MAYLTEDYISRSLAIKKFSFDPISIKETDYGVKSRIFLSHSHLDKELARNLIRIFYIQANAMVYVDWNDSTMPRVTNAETARKIKKRINDLDMFILLATAFSLNSKWVPWEIGLADVLKAYDKIVIIPIEDKTGKFVGNEYLQVYKRIELDSINELSIFDPNSNQNGIKFSRWVTGQGNLWR
jgi:hypothetical protein